MAPSTAVVARNYAAAPLDQRAMYAKSLAAASDLIPIGLRDKQTGQPSPGKILLVMETGSMLGLHPMAAIQGIHVVEGRATISPQLMTGLIRQAGHRITVKRSGTIPAGDFTVTVTGTRKDTGDVYEDTWDIPRAIRAGLVKSYTQDPRTKLWVIDASKDNWRKYPENMCTWRATGNVGREGFDDVLMGCGYTPEEVETDYEVDEDGTVIEADPTARENEEIAAFKKLDDREDMRQVYRRLHRDGFWTGRLDAEFAAHLSTLTKDSNPPQGAPGNTGDAAVDDQNIVDADIVDESDAAAVADMAGTFFEDAPEAEEPLPTTTATVQRPQSTGPRDMTEEEYLAWEQDQLRRHEQGLI